MRINESDFPFDMYNVLPYFRIVCVNGFCLCKRCVMWKRFAILSSALATSVFSRPPTLCSFSLTPLPIHFHLIESDERKSFYLSYHTRLLSARHFPSFLVFGEHTLTGLHTHAIKTVKRAVSIAKQQHDVSATSDRKKINFFCSQCSFVLFCCCLLKNVVVFFQISIWNILRCFVHVIC